MTAAAPSEPNASGPIDFGARHISLRAFGRASLRLHQRSVLVNAALVVGIGILAVVALCLGDYPLTPAQVFDALIGAGDTTSQLIVREWRLPALLAAIWFGALLGASGAVFQSLTKNPLGSPDIIGFDAGAYTAVLIAVTVLGAREAWSLSAAAVLGGLITAGIVMMLAQRRGISGFRLIVIGIAGAAMLGAINSVIITRADIRDAVTVGFWGAGSLTNVGWAQLLPAALLGVLALLLTLAFAAPMTQLELGDDAARSQGVAAAAVRIALLATGVALIATVTAVSGPIGFVALAAPQLARRATAAPRPSVTNAAAMGAALLTAAHTVSLLLAQVFQPVPVGVVTVCLGGGYLIWLLIRENRKGAL